MPLGAIERDEVERRDDRPVTPHGDVAPSLLGVAEMEHFIARDQPSDLLAGDFERNRPCVERPLEEVGDQTRRRSRTRDLTGHEEPIGIEDLDRDPLRLRSSRVVLAVGIAPCVDLPGATVLTNSVVPGSTSIRKAPTLAGSSSRLSTCTWTPSGCTRTSGVETVVEPSASQTISATRGTSSTGDVGPWSRGLGGSAHATSSIEPATSTEASLISSSCPSRRGG